MEISVEKRDSIFQPPAAGCALYLPGLPGGGNRIYDRSCAGNHGVINGALWKRSAGGLWCLQYDGADDYVQCPDNAALDISQEITILLWVKRQSLNRRDLLVMKRLVGMNDCNYEFEITNDPGYGNRLYFSYQDNAGGWEPNVYGQSVIDTRWHQVGVTRSPQKIKFYIDGKIDAESTPTKQMNAVNTHPVIIGALPGIAYFSGCLALIRVYPRALAALEIQNRFQDEKFWFN